MHPHTDTINRFYTAFAGLDTTTMATCYADDVQFQDELFTLNGKHETMGMWNMLISATLNNPASKAAWHLEFSGVQADASSGQAHWDANYLFSATGRHVINKIDAQFYFDEAGLIVRHHDRFNFWTWSSQALGIPGLLLGWTPYLRAKVRATANGNLQKFLAKNNPV
ncbi:MAG: nuclear transport factor 2 family protein [Burkholderiaceae bacterium]|nr:nuclear transport factor 2 family protein [Burkholderiaceae bacterium]